MAVITGMTDVSTRNFGLLIAYLIPGFVVVATAGAYSETIRSWIGTSAVQAPSIGGFLYATLASVACGMTVNAIRWLVLDQIHYWTGVPRPRWELSLMAKNREAFETFVEYHYRYYQFYGNSLIALAIALFAGRPLFALPPIRPSIVGAACVAAMILFFIASRDTFRKYHVRTNSLLTR